MRIGMGFFRQMVSDNQSLQTIETINIVPVDLNCLLYTLEKQIASMSKEPGKHALSDKYTDHAEKRREAIQNYMWNRNEGYYFDYHLGKMDQTSYRTLAGKYPLYAETSSTRQAEMIAGNQNIF